MVSRLGIYLFTPVTYLDIVVVVMVMVVVCETDRGGRKRNGRARSGAGQIYVVTGDKRAHSGAVRSRVEYLGRYHCIALWWHRQGVHCGICFDKAQQGFSLDTVALPCQGLNRIRAEGAAGSVGCAFRESLSVPLGDKAPRLYVR